jgi:hypothetical protein
MTTPISRLGIVEGIEAQRKDKDVKYLSASLRFETELDGTYYNEATKIDTITISLPVSSGVNPGDAVIAEFTFQPPIGERFVPALTVGDDSEEVIEV